MSDEVFLIVVGGLVALVTSISTSLMMFWMEGQRAERTERLLQRREDIRTVSKWAENGRRDSLRGVDVTGANFAGTDLAGADLEEAQLVGAIFRAVNLSGANLRGANMRRITLHGVKLNNAKLIGVDLTGANFIRVDFSGAILKNAKLLHINGATTCVWNDVVIDETTEASDAVLQAIITQTEQQVSQKVL